MPRPATGDFAEYYGKYINLIEEDDLLTGFKNQQIAVEELFKNIDEEKSTYKYGPDKWSIKGVMQHLIDGDRVFTYRALCVARGEKNDLPGFDQDIYAAASLADIRMWKDIADEFLHLRESTVDLFKSIPESALLNKGMANGNPINALSIGYIILGHTAHHIRILKERYL